MNLQSAQLVLTFGRAIAAILSRQDFGSQAENVQEAAKWLNLGFDLADMGVEGYQELKKLTEKVQAMADENRKPTLEEFNELRALSDEAHATIQNWKPRQDVPEV